jgi:hypothetical protein
LEPDEPEPDESDPEEPEPDESDPDPEFEPEEPEPDESEPGPEFEPDDPGPEFEYTGVGVAVARGVGVGVERGRLSRRTRGFALRLRSWRTAAVGVAVAIGTGFLELRVVIARAAQLVERGAVDDPVQPRAQVAHLVAALQRPPGREMRLLQRVLGARLGQVPARRPQQRAPVALHDRLERPLVARAGEQHVPFVCLGAQQNAGRRRYRHAPATRECRRA